MAAAIASQIQSLSLSSMHESPQSLKPHCSENVEKLLGSTLYIRLLKEKRNSRSQRISQGQGKIINQKMRNRVVKWLQEISHETFQFNNSTLYTAVQILDQYLLLSNEHYSSLQLIAATCLYMSSKLQQRNIVAGQCYVECADGLFTKQDLEQKELLIFQALGFDISFPNPIKMIRAFTKISNVDLGSLKEGQQFLIQNIIENGNVGHHYLDIASAVTLAMIQRALNSQSYCKKLNQIVFP